MLFVELRFFVFFAVVFAVYWLLRGQLARKLWLLGASYVFYGAWDWRFLGLIFLSTAMDYTFGQILARRQIRRRRAIVALSVVANLGLLGVFKYYDFFIESAATLIGHGWHPRLLHLILPAGMSFYTFESISYTVGVYRGDKPAKSLLDFALYLAFFPHLVAGPILRPADLLPQLEAPPRRIGDVDLRSGLVLFVHGFIKKACIGDAIAVVTDGYFAAPEQYHAGAAWLCAFGYVIQVYCDFSGYTDMARGSARLLGYELVENFRFPYLARSFSDLWQRWHISLSFWFRDYLYAPLGGGRRHRSRNLLITFVACGLWHGAAWHFVIWGASNGLVLVVETYLRRKRWLPRHPRSALGIPVVFTLFAVLGVFFRASDLHITGVVFRQLFTLASDGTKSIPAAFAALLAGLAVWHIAAERRIAAEWWRRLPEPLFAAGLGVVAALALAAMQLHYRPFVYFQF